VTFNLWALPKLCDPEAATNRLLEAIRP
jgi:hypothetical protein